MKKTEAWLRANAKPEIVEYTLNLKEEMKGYRDRAELAERQVRDLTVALEKAKRDLAYERSL